MISVPVGTDDIANAMISASQMIYASRMKGTDIISCLPQASISCGDSRISYRTSDISLKRTLFYDIISLIGGDPFENSRYKKRMVKTILGSIQEALLPKLQRITYNN